MAIAQPMPPADAQACILWDEHVAKLAAIREALKAERSEVEDLLQSYDAPDTGLVRRTLWQKQDALDALLVAP